MPLNAPYGTGRNAFGEEDPREVDQEVQLTQVNVELSDMGLHAMDVFKSSRRAMPTEREIWDTRATTDELLSELWVRNYNTGLK